MTKYCSINFRGVEIDITITKDSGYEYDTGAHDIEWYFTNYSAEQYNSLNVTAEEEDNIQQQIYRCIQEGEGDD